MNLLTTLIFLFILKFLFAENKFMNSVRNLTNTNNHTRESDGVRKKLERYVGECRGDDKDYSGSFERTSTDFLRGFRKGSDGATYPAFYGNNNQQNTRNFRNRKDNGHVDGYLTSYGERNTCENRDMTNTNSNNGRTNNFDFHDPNEGYYNNQNRYNQRQDYDRTNRDFTETFPRWKRDFNEKCVSQCVFSYLELLDENRSPSESAFIQFLQENTSNDRERIKIVREARRCFAKFVTTAEEEDGCEFSRSLSKCLRLNLD